MPGHPAGALPLMHTDKTASELTGNRAENPALRLTAGRPAAAPSGVFMTHCVRLITGLTSWQTVSPVSTPLPVNEVL